jgi:transmembrane sensor
MSAAIPNADEARARAAQWLLKRRDSDCWTEQDQTDLEAWLSDSVAHRIAYLRLEAAWSEADRLTILRANVQPSVAAGLRKRFLFPLRVAAVVAVTAVLGTGTFFYATQPEGKVYETPVGGRKILTLADGSRVEMNTNATLRITMHKGERRVALMKGEAFFQITHDPAHPFVVEAGHFRVVDIGTKFSVRREAGRTQVELVEGSARFESANVIAQAQSILMTPGDVILATADSISLHRKTVDDLDSALGWRRGVLVFHHTPLSEVAAEFNRYNRRKIEIADPQLAARTITATLPTNDLAAFMRVTQNFFGLRAEQHGDEIIISR